MNNKTRVAGFFDLDETVIRGASSWLLTRALYKRGFGGPADLWFAAKQAFLYVALGEDHKRVDAIRARALEVVSGHSQDEVYSVAEEVCAYLLENRVFPATLKIIERHKRYGHDVWLISAAPQELPATLASRLGITGGLGSQIALENGIFQARMAAPIMHGQGKADAVRQLAKENGYDLKQCFAYSDSINDLPLLSSVGKPSVINPDFRLRWWAKQRGWPIHDFRFWPLWRRRPSEKTKAQIRERLKDVYDLNS